MNGGQRGRGPSIAEQATGADVRPPAADPRIRRYRRDDAVVFLKTREEFGGLSNMAAGFPLCVNGTKVRTSEALYQACRFPHLPDVQRDILEQRSPMTAKMKSKPHRGDSRPDWNGVRVTVMRWCLRLKLAQNWETFGPLLESTGDRPIVEESRRDAFWGAKPAGDHLLIGINILGRLLMELRGKAREEGWEAFRSVLPPGLDNFRLLDSRVNTVVVSDAFTQSDIVQSESLDAVSPGRGSRHAPAPPVAAQMSNARGARRDGDLIARIHSLVIEHPVSRPEINAAVAPLLPASFSDKEKKKRITLHLRQLSRAGWIAFHKDDQRWKPGDCRALSSAESTSSARDRAARLG